MTAARVLCEHRSIQGATQLWVAQRVSTTRAEGPHARAALWVAGCSLRCPGCCNPELFERGAGQAVSLLSLQRWVVQARSKHGIEGVSVLGGEPLEQWEALAPFLGFVKSEGLGVVVYTGLRWSQIRSKTHYARLPARVDTLVDGPFVQSMPEPSSGRATVGSRNQGLVHFSERYRDQALWRGPLRAHAQVLADGQVQLHGAPALVAKLKARLQPTTRSAGDHLGALGADT